MIGKFNGREWGIRTPGGVNLAGFQNRSIRPTLATLYINISGANGENRTHTPKRERDFKSRASTSSATLAHYFKKYILKWSGIIIKKILFVKTFNKIFFFF